MTSNFKNFLAMSEEKDALQAIKNVIDGQNLILFFKKADGIFGAPEESRIVFARMKNPQDEREEDDCLDKDASFMAFDLLRAISGQMTQNIFGQDDLNKITILDKDQAEKLLMKNKPKTIKLTLKPKKEPGFIKLKDRSK